MATDDAQNVRLNEIDKRFDAIDKRFDNIENMLGTLTSVLVDLAKIEGQQQLLFSQLSMTDKIVSKHTEEIENLKTKTWFIILGASASSSGFTALMVRVLGGF